MVALQWCVSFSVQFSHSVVSSSLPPHGLQHARLPCPSPTRRACSNSCPMSQWCHPTISSSAVPFSSSPQSFPGSGSFPLSWLQIRASASASVLPMNIRGWFPLGLTGLISLLDSLISLVGSLAGRNEVPRKQIHATDLYKEAKLLIYCKKYDYQVHWVGPLSRQEDWCHRLEEEPDCKSWAQQTVHSLVQWMIDKVNEE